MYVTLKVYGYRDSNNKSLTLLNKKIIFVKDSLKAAVSCCSTQNPQRSILVAQIFLQRRESNYYLIKATYFKVMYISDIINSMLQGVPCSVPYYSSMQCSLIESIFHELLKIYEIRYLFLAQLCK